MKKFQIIASTSLAAVLTLTACAEKKETAKEPAAEKAKAAQSEWVVLFDGKTLDGWIQKNGTATFEVKDGAIVGTTAEGSPNSFLCTVKDYGDFELEFETKVDNKLNSGVMFRSMTKDGKPENRVTGPQCEVEATNIGGGGEAGYIYGEAIRRWLTPNDKRIPHKHFKDGEWNKFRIVAKGANIKTWINGEQVSDLTDEEIYKDFAKGFIGLQVHSIGKKQGPFQAAWRNIRIKDL